MKVDKVPAKDLQDADQTKEDRECICDCEKPFPDPLTNGRICEGCGGDIK